ncbi:MAG: alkaline phosphatase D family protein [Pseudomonadota bacterium]
MGFWAGRVLGVSAAALAVASCQSSDLADVPVLGALAPSESAVDALNRYYEDFPVDTLPVAPAGASMPSSDATLTRILVGSCNDEEQASPALSRIAQEDADLFLMIGDNVYGDRDGRAYSNNQPELDELRESFADLAARPEFQDVRAKHPMMVAWDDHDYGVNDGGRDFAFKGLAEKVHERFWGLDNQDVGAWPGTYYARTFGEDGQRTQIIVLDTRFFRSSLTPTDEWGATGKERYIPATGPDSMQDMLGAAQWTWLENQLAEPADLRLIVSSIQVLPDAHGWESWDKLPAERARLYEKITHSGAEGVVFVSGDRHNAFLYSSVDVLPYPVSEITASSLNLSFSDATDEVDAAQIGAGYSKENFGSINIDWDAGAVTLAIHDLDGNAVRETRVSFRRP